MKQNDLLRHCASVERILSALDCPRALTVVMMMRNGMWDDIATLNFRHNDYGCVDSMFRAYQATKLLSKAEWLPTSWDTESVAKTKFWEAENACRETNVLLDAYFQGRVKFPHWAESAINAARLKIGRVLWAGDAKHHLYDWVERCSFGPGADGSTSHGETSVYNKLSSPGDITQEAYPYLNAMTGITSLGRLFVGNLETKRLEIELVRGNKITFVSKNAKTDRSIAVEPRWNMFFQKGVGNYLRDRLKRFGVNLDHQGLNQALAIFGSRTQEYGTLDLASASDTISRSLVWLLLPHDWACLLDDLRSKSFFLDGKWHPYEKWSSMGNGYTFELESLIFWALASSIDEKVAVYGDDIVVPSESYERVVELLRLVGFRVNQEKSFVHGVFRESCGADAYFGDDVTPIYWKKPLHEQGIITLVNQVSRLAERLGGPGTRFLGLKAAWRGLIYQLPKRFQVRGPRQISTVIHDSQEQWRGLRRFGWDGLFLNIMVPLPIKVAYQNFEAACVSLTISQRTKTFSKQDRLMRDLSELGGKKSDGWVVRDRYIWKKKTVFIPRGDEGPGSWC